VIEYLRPVRERYQQLAADVGYIESVLAQGAQKAAPLAAQTLQIVKERVGLG